MRLKNAELNIIISNSRLFASTETRGFCVLIWKPSHRLTGKADDDLCYWPRYSRSLKVFLILKSFRSKDLACIRTRRKVRAQKALQTWRTGVMLPQKIYNFTSLVWNFCRWGADVPPDETSLATRSKEKRLYSQARITENYRWQRQTCMYLIINNTFFFHSRRQTKGKRTQMSYLVAVHLHDRCPSSISASKISKVTENWN